MHVLKQQIQDDFKQYCEAMIYYRDEQKKREIDDSEYYAQEFARENDTLLDVMHYELSLVTMTYFTQVNVYYTNIAYELTQYTKDTDLILTAITSLIESECE